MKNLKLYSKVALQLDTQCPPNEENFFFSALDIECNRLFFASSSNIVYACSISSFQNEDSWINTTAAGEIHHLNLEEDDGITSFDYLMEKEALVIGTRKGSLLLYHVNDCITESVGQVEGGVSFISPSPDGDLLAIISCSPRLLLLTRDWDVIDEADLLDLQPDDFHVKGSVTGHAFESFISWRGDGKYFASIINQQGSSSKTRVMIWERDSAKLHASTETSSMKTVLAWMPSGAKIASVVDRTSIAFFERNGLARSTFAGNDAEIDSLHWNSKSDLLASVVKCGEYDAVRVWSFSNSRWYLKQELRFLVTEKVKAMWDAVNPLVLFCWTANGRIERLKFVWVTSVKEKSVAFVIDGAKLQITPLSLCLVPPPLSLFTLKFPSPVQDVATLDSPEGIHVSATLANGGMCVTRLPELESLFELEGKEIAVDDFHPFGCILQHTWLNSNRILLVCHHDGFHLLEVEGFEVKFRSKMENIVVSLTRKDSSAVIQLEGGKLLEYNSKIRPSNVISFSSSCPVVRYTMSDTSPLLFGVDEAGKLQIGGRIFCYNCSDFAVYSSSGDPNRITHLIILTGQDLLYVLDISDAENEEKSLKIENSLHAKKKKGEELDYINVWERGSQIVGVLHGDEASIIIQTNRGNLECIYPRKLVLSSISNALSQYRFKDALTMVRRHRMNFNTIVDLCGREKFIHSCPLFVNQINNLSSLTEFVCSIKGDGASEILSAIRSAVEEHIPESSARELCILTTLARSEPPQLEEALRRIKATRDIEMTGSSRPSYPSAEEALKHLLWLTDCDSVFDTALGLYDLNLTAMVALNSQKDPKEFLPYLEELKRMPDAMMLYRIDLKLNRLESALKHIVSAGDSQFSECMDLMSKHPHLFPLGLEMIPEGERRMAIVEAWGDHLAKEKKMEEAACAYLRCRRFEKAMKAYREGGDWRGAMRLAGVLGMGFEETKRLASELCEEMQAMGKTEDAAKICIEYCGDLKSAVGFLIAGRDWEEALRVAYMSTPEMVEEIKTAAAECAAVLISEYEEGAEKVGKYLSRYTAVRQRRLVLEGKVKENEDVDDGTTSLADSNVSGMSAYSVGKKSASAASSKGRGRRAAKGARIRAGSPGEEVALVEHVKGMALTEEVMKEVRSLMICLLTIGMEEPARKLHRVLQNYHISHLAALHLVQDASHSSQIDLHSHHHYIHLLQPQNIYPSCHIPVLSS